MINKILRFVVNSFWNLIYPELSDKEVEGIYSLCKTPFQFEVYLCSHGFNWASDGLNFNILTDSFEKPSQVLSRKWANCSGFLRLYSVLFDKLGIKHKETLLLHSDGMRWHYINIFQYEGKFYQQSNIALTEITNFGKLWQEWKDKGYTKRMVDL